MFVAFIISYVLDKDVLRLLTCLLVLLVVAEGLPASEVDVCDQGYYLNISQYPPDESAQGSNSNCVPCSTCAADQGVLTPCLNATDTKCQACSQGYYSQYLTTHSNRLCTVCTNCSTLNRIEMTECTPLGDSVCGKCSRGYFLSVNYDGGTECVKCSYCPPGKDVVKWYGCVDLPDNQQCAPGYSIPPPTSSPVTTPNLEWIDLLAALKNHTRHGFISVPDRGILTSDEPPSELGLVVSLVSLLFTVATLCVFVCAVSCFVKRHRGQCCNKSHRGRRRTQYNYCMSNDG